MAQQVTADAFLLGVYKRYYTDERIKGVFFRNSPVGREITKNRVEGQSYNFTVPYDRGGAVSGDYTVAVAAAASSVKTAEFAVQPGKIHSVFIVTQNEILAARTKRGGYLRSLALKLFGSLEGTRKMFAASLYGYGIGDIGFLPVAAVAGLNAFTVSYDTVVKMAIGTQFYVTNGNLPTSAVYDANIRTVSAIDGTTITFTGVAITAGGWAVGSIVYIVGGRDATPAPNMPTGLAGWIPYLANRTGVNWTTYVATAFYGVTRSTSTNGLAGWFTQRANGELYIDAVVRGVSLARRGGGVPDIIAINDEDWLTMNGEVNQQTTMMQQINTSGAKNAKTEVARGLAALRFAFSTNWIEYVYDDPYCPKGYAWILEKDSFEFVSLTNVQKVIEDGVTGNEPGAAVAEDQDDVDTTFKLLIDDFINIAPNSTSTEGPAAQVSVSLVGNFAARSPGHNSVIVF
jgi:hypothetical protein